MVNKTPLIIIGVLLVLCIISSLVIVLNKRWFARVKSWFGTSLQDQANCFTTTDEEILLNIIDESGTCPIAPTPGTSGTTQIPGTSGTTYIPGTSGTTPPPPPTGTSGTTPPPPPTGTSGTTPPPPPTGTSGTTPPPPPTGTSGTTPPPPPTGTSGTTPQPPIVGSPIDIGSEITAYILNPVTNGYCISTDENPVIKCNNTQPTESGKFRIKREAQDVYYISTTTGRDCYSEVGGIICAPGDADYTFKGIVSNESMFIKKPDDNYCHIDDDYTIQCNKDTFGPNDYFKLEQVIDYYQYIKNKRYRSNVGWIYEFINGDVKVNGQVFYMYSISGSELKYFDAFDSSTFKFRINTDGTLTTIEGNTFLTLISWSSTYRVENFVQFTGEDTDLPAQPMQGTLQDCETTCTSKSDCIGFTREKSAPADTVSECWLKKNFPVLTLNNDVFHTFVKPQL